MVCAAAVMVSMVLLQAQGAERASSPDAGAAQAAGYTATKHERRSQKAPKQPRNRGSWDVPKVDTIYGQQSATYEDLIGDSKPMPGIVVPPRSDTEADADTPPRQRESQKDQKR